MFGFPLVEPLEPRQLFAFYFISPSGSDRNSGSANHPWRTIERVNRQAFRGGDRVLFEGGQSFDGSIYLGPDDRGSKQAPIAISSYGTGRARINGGFHGRGLFAYNTAGLEISDLNFSGPLARGTASGILLFNDLPGDRKLDYIRIDNVTVTRHYVGIEIGGNRGASGFRDVWVTNAELYNNRDAGLVTYAAQRNVHEKLLIQNVNAFNNTGIPMAPDAPFTKVNGSGIVLGGVNGATVEHSVAHHNGALGDGGVGIWAYGSNKVLFEFDESFANKTGGLRDGDGFDLDQNVSNSVMQYNYAHDNDGAGFLLASYHNNDLHTNTIVRYNLSENDARKVGMGAIHAFGRITNSQWYNNTVYLEPNGRSTPYGMQIFNGTIEDHYAANIFVRNNAIRVSGGVRAVSVTSEQLDGATGIRFEGNGYFATDGPLKIRWGDRDYTSLSSWRDATGQERLNGQDVGLSSDPRFNPRSNALQSDSPLIDRGLDLAGLFGLATGGRDFLGNLVASSTSDVGAFEFVG